MLNEAEVSPIVPITLDPFYYSVVEVWSYTIKILHVLDNLVAFVGVQVDAFLDLEKSQFLEFSADSVAERTLGVRNVKEH